MDFLHSKSWKTTSTGLAQVFISIGTIGAMLKSGAYDWNVMTLALTNIVGGFGLIVAKDKDVSGLPPAEVIKK